MAIDEVFAAADYVRARRDGGDVDEIAAYAMACRADATRLERMVARIKRERDDAIETRDAARKAFDEVLQQRQDALAELKEARQIADALAAAHAESSRLRDETIETLQREIAALQQREAYVQQERECAAANAAMWYEQKDEAIDKLRVAFEERDAAVAERNKLRDTISIAYGERDSAITARNGARAEAERASRQCVETELRLGETMRRIWAALRCNGEWLPSINEMEARARMLCDAQADCVALAERAERERDRAAKAHAEAAGVVDRLGCRIVDLEAEVLCLQGERDRARAEIEEMRVELNSRMNEANESRRLARDLAEMTVSRDQAREWAESLRQRPTYEARTTPPTPEELAAHRTQHGGWWVLTSVGERPRLLRLGPDDAGGHAPDLVYVALADGLPCAWPVVEATT